MNKHFTQCVIVLLLLTHLSCHQQEQKEDTHINTYKISDTMLAHLETHPVTLETLRNEILFYGKIVPDNNKLIEIFPIVGGNVISVNVELGDYVKKGQVLAVIKSTEVASFQKDLEDARNDFIVAKNNYRVAQDLFDGKLNSEKDVLEAKNTFEKAQSQLHRVEETYKIYNLKEGAIYEITSPINGFIIQKNINQDMLLRGDRTNNVFDIADIENVWAIANVSEVDINQVRLGAAACVSTLTYADKTFLGRVDKIFNVIDPETKAMKIRVKLSNADYLLKPEMQATIKISYNEKSKQIAVPSSAIIFDKNKYFIMVYKDTTHIDTKVVEILRQVGDITYLKRGVDIGENVITKNQLLIYDALND